MTNQVKEYKTYHSLIVYQKASDLALMVYKLTENFPKSELFGIISQLRRAATSVFANIAEGYSRNSEREKVRFLNMAQGSLVELRCFMEFANKLGYLNDKDLTYFTESAEEVIKLICGLIKSIRIKFNTSH